MRNTKPVAIPYRKTNEPLLEERRKKILKLREEGATYAEIGIEFGISKQRAFRIVNGNSYKRKSDDLSDLVRVYDEVVDTDF